MAKKCDLVTCTEPTDAEIVVCRDCNASFHSKCVNLKKPAVTAIKENDGIHWNCKECSTPSMKDMLLQMVECTKAVMQLIAKLSPLIDTNKSVNLPSTPIMNLFPGQSNHGSANKRRRVEFVSKSNAETPMIFGTNENSSDLKTAALSKQVYVSFLHPSTTEEEIMDHIKQKAGLVDDQPLACKKLISPGRNLDELSFVSFKITCSETNFPKIIDAAIWPKQIAVREFVNRKSSRPPRLGNFLPRNEQ